MDGNLFTTEDPLGNTVTLTAKCFYLHILVEHPDLFDVDEIRRTIRSPDYITEDVLESGRSVYYCIYQRRPQRWMIKVVVQQDVIVTAYRVKRIKQGEEVLWRR